MTAHPESGWTAGPWLLKATPWPWGFYPTTVYEIITEEVRGCDDDEYEFHTSIVTVNNAAVGDGTASKFGEYPCAHEAEANARLIAAAPEAIKCAEILAALESDDGGRMFPTKQDCQFARMVLAKARGESQ